MPGLPEYESFSREQLLVQLRREQSLGQLCMMLAAGISARVPADADLSRPAFSVPIEERDWSQISGISNLLLHRVIGRPLDEVAAMTLEPVASEHYEDLGQVVAAETRLIPLTERLSVAEHRLYHFDGSGQLVYWVNDNERPEA